MRRLFSLLAILSCTVISPPQVAAQAVANPQAKLAEATNGFGFQIFARLAQENFNGSKAPENIFISPASIAWAFEMLFNGAEGPTLDVMAKTFGVPGWNLAELNAANLALKQSLEKADPKVEIAIANGLFGKAGIQFLPAFLAATQQYYAAKLAALTTAEAINAWIREQTRGKITGIVRSENITPETILILVNALYFKGAWQKPFTKTLTSPQPFHLWDGKSKSHPLMTRSGSFLYYEDAGLQAIRLPYGDGRLGMVVLLPAANSSLKALVATLNAARWQAVTSGLAQRPGKLILPRFKAEYSTELSQIFQAMGMGLPFTEQADFKKLATLPPGYWTKISAVLHKTFVEVNEEGTVAAAVTAITMRAGAAPPPPQAPFTMTVDRPFFAAIQDGGTGSLLFLGAIVDPLNPSPE